MMNLYYKFAEKKVGQPQSGKTFLLCCHLFIAPTNGR